MSEIVTGIGAVFTGAVGWITTIAGFITDTPIILFFLALPVVGFAIGMIRKFIPKKK